MTGPGEIAHRYIARDGDEGADNAALDAKAVDGDEMDRLAALSPLEYDRERKEAAERLCVRASVLDREIAKRRKKGGQGDSIDGWEVESWTEPVSGADLLDSISTTASSHLVLPPGAADAIALWTVFAHAHDCFDVSPILAATSPTPECGKTTMLTFLGGVVPRPLPASNITAAALFRAVEKWSPCVLIDEADTYLRSSDELRGVLNSGHSRANAFVIRTTGDDHEPARFHTWAPKAVALIGKLPATLASRAVHTELRRKTADEQIVPLRLDRLGHLEPLARRAARWADDNALALSAADPEMPEGISGRMADNWRPLLAVADVAGGEWPSRARRVAEKLSLARTEQAAGITLLEDIKAIFKERRGDQITSAELVETLTAKEDRPWPEWKAGKPITARQVARLLEPFEISPGQLWLNGSKSRGYEREAFADAFNRYLGFRSGSPVEPAENSQNSANRSGRNEKILPDEIAKKPQKSGHPTALPDRNPVGVAEGWCHPAPERPARNEEQDRLDALDERAAILQFEAGLSREEADAEAYREANR